MKKLVVLFLFAGASFMFAQDLYQFDFGVALRDSAIVQSAIIDTGFIQEGTAYTIPPHDFSPDYPVIQFLYDAFAGSKFLFDDLTDENILISMRLVFNKRDGLPPQYFDERLFFVLIVDVFKMPGRIPVTGDYFFKPNAFFGYLLPKTERLRAVLQLLNLDPSDLGFAFIRSDRFDGANIETINTPNDVRFKAKHFSKFGGGRGHITGTTDVKNETAIPLKFSLSQNYPNPFNPSTKIKYSIPAGNTQLESSGTLVILKVYDMLGREVTTLVNERKSPGLYEVTFSANDLPSGVYFYKLTVEKYSAVRKMILIR